MNYKAQKQATMSLMKADLEDNLSMNVMEYASGNPQMFEVGNTSGEFGSVSTGGEANALYVPNNLGAWDYFQNYYYPYVIKESYPVYIQERAQDKGKQAFEIIKALKDKKFIKLDKVEDFIDAMDTLIKII